MLVCAKLGVALLHSRPYRPQGKGKIERWFQSVRRQLLTQLSEADTASLEVLNWRLAARIGGNITHHIQVCRAGKSIALARTVRTYANCLVKCDRLSWTVSADAAAAAVGAAPARAAGGRCRGEPPMYRKQFALTAFPSDAGGQTAPGADRRRGSTPA